MPSAKRPHAYRESSKTTALLEASGPQAPVSGSCRASRRITVFPKPAPTNPPTQSRRCGAKRRPCAQVIRPQASNLLYSTALCLHNPLRPVTRRALSGFQPLRLLGLRYTMSLKGFQKAAVRVSILQQHFHSRHEPGRLNFSKIIGTTNSQAEV